MNPCRAVEVHAVASEAVTCTRVAIAITRFGQHAAADGRGAEVVSCLPNRLLTRNQAITALTVAELLEIGHAEDDPFVTALREELW